MLRRKLFFFFSPLLLSLFLYVFYRTDQTVINDLIISLITPDIYYPVKTYIGLQFPLSSWLIYSLPGGLWVFSSTLISQGFYVQMKQLDLDCSLIPLIFAVGLEIQQGLGIVKGTFDPLDIVLILLFWSLARSIFVNKIRRTNLIGNFNVETIVCIFSYSIVFLAHVWK